MGDIDELYLISIIKAYPELYTNKKYNLELLSGIRKIWREIAATFGTTPDVVKLRWKRLRDNFRRSEAFRKFKKGMPSTKMRPVKYAKELAFLLPFINLTDKHIFRDRSKGKRPVSQKDITAPPIKQENNQEIINLDEATNCEPLYIKNFFNNLAKTVEKLPEDIQARIKSDVFNIVSNAQEEVLLRNNSKSFESR